jgi:hypothetical protein
MVYSHDHGAYLPPSGLGHWLRDSLVAVAGQPHVLPYPAGNLSRQAVAKVAEALEAVDRVSLVEIMRSIPASWPVSAEELEYAGWFLEYRAPSVAVRLRELA